MNNTATNHNTTSRFTCFCAFALAHIAIIFPLTASAIIGGGGDDKTCGRYTYTTFGNEATITEFDDYEYEGDLVITNELDGYTVTSIGWNAFKYCDNLTAVTIPVTVTSIGDWAFQGCTSLATITIPSPPSHCRIARHRLVPAGRSSRLGKAVVPVVVTPDIASK